MMRYSSERCSGVSLLLSFEIPLFVLLHLGPRQEKRQCEESVDSGSLPYDLLLPIGEPRNSSSIIFIVVRVLKMLALDFLLGRIAITCLSGCFSKLH